MSQGEDFVAVKTITATGSETVKAAATGVCYHVQQIVIAIQVHHATGTICLTDGTTTFLGPWLCKDGNGNHIFIDFGEKGYPWGSGKAVVVTCATNDVTANVTIKGYAR